MIVNPGLYWRCTVDARRMDTAEIEFGCQRKCTGRRPEERTDGACQSIEEEVVVYIHHEAALLPVLLSVCSDVIRFCTFHPRLAHLIESHLLGICLALTCGFAVDSGGVCVCVSKATGTMALLNTYICY